MPAHRSDARRESPHRGRIRLRLSFAAPSDKTRKARHGCKQASHLDVLRIGDCRSRRFADRLRWGWGGGGEAGAPQAGTAPKVNDQTAAGQLNGAYSAASALHNMGSTSTTLVTKDAEGTGRFSTVDFALAKLNRLVSSSDAGPKSSSGMIGRPRWLRRKPVNNSGRHPPADLVARENSHVRALSGQRFEGARTCSGTSSSTLIRAAGRITDEYEFVVVGSQSVLGALERPPAECTLSDEADIFPLNAEGKSDLIDAMLGEVRIFTKLMASMRKVSTGRRPLCLTVGESA